MPSKIQLTDEQLFNAALAYELSKCDMPMEDYLKSIYSLYKEIEKTYKTLHSTSARIGNKHRLGL